MKKLTFLAFAILSLLLTSSQVFAQAGHWTTYTRANSGLIGDSIVAIAFDADGTPWVAAWQGVAKQTESGWTFYNTPPYMTSNDIWDMDYANGSLWFGHRHGLTAFNGIEWTTYTTTNSGLVHAPVICLAHDALENLWVGTQRGLNAFNRDKVSTFKRENTPAIPYDGFQALATDAANNLWISFIGTAGIVKFPGGNSVNAKYIKQDSIPGFPKGPVYIKSLAVDWNGNLWAGTARHGVVRINESGATVFSKLTTGVMQNDTIHSVAIDGCGNVWVGSKGDACMYDGTTWYSFTKSTGNLPDDHVFKIKADPAGHVWIGTKGGVTVFKPLPDAPELIMPQMNMTMNDDSVLCKWTWECPNITKYWYEIATNEQFAFSTIDTTSPSLMESATKLDTGLENNTTYYWRTRAKNDAGWGPFSPTWIFHVSYPSAVEMGPMMNSRCELMQNYPNPCIDRTTIEFTMRRHQNVCLKLYDILGRECGVLIDKQVGPGSYAMPVDVSALPEGMYVYCLRAGSDVVYRTMHVSR